MDSNKNFLQNFSRPQVIALGVIAFIMLLIVGIATGIIPGLKEKKTEAPELNLTVWGVADEAQAFDIGFLNYSRLHPNVRISYRKIDEANYEQELINALAAGKGPDIFMVNNSWIPKHFDKMAPLSAAQFTLTQVRSLFPEVVEKDFLWNNSIYALPLYIDTLALFYNQDIFDNTAIAVAPSDWLGFENLFPKLRQIEVNGNIIKAAAAIGGSEKTVHNAADLLSLLMLQAGTEMTTENFRRASFVSSLKGGQPGLESLNFYTSFADPKGLYYTWNESMPYSPDAFSQGRVAMIFEYADQINVLKNKNPFLKIKVAGMPQPAARQEAINYANYRGLAISKYTQYPEWVWDLVVYLTTDTATAENYLTITKRPPALRTLIQKYANDPDIGVFAKQALTAQSWLKPDPDKTRQIFSQMIEAVVSKRLEAYEALSQAERAVSDLIQQINKEPGFSL